MEQESSGIETTRREAARAMGAAAEQIALALRESRPQVEALGEALQQLAAVLAQQGGSATIDVAALGAVMRRAVIRLQFYDRMTQHLSHVQDYLSRSADQMDCKEPAGGWTGVHRQLSDRLLSDTQRFHLAKDLQEGMLASTLSGNPDRCRRDKPGDIDLF